MRSPKVQPAQTSQSTTTTTTRKPQAMQTHLTPATAVMVHLLVGLHRQQEAVVAVVCQGKELDLLGDPLDGTRNGNAVIS